MLLGSTKDGTPCIRCKYLRKALVTRKSRLKKRQETPSKICGIAGRKLKACTRRNKRLLLRLGSLEKDTQRLRNESAATAQEALAAKIKSLPPKQQLAVRQCFEAAKRKSLCGMHCDEWMLECILLNIRFPKLYRYMRKQNILALPSETTIRKYTARYRTGYGFNETMLRVLKNKATQVDTCAGMEESSSKR